VTFKNGYRENSGLRLAGIINDASALSFPFSPLRATLQTKRQFKIIGLQEIFIVKDFATGTVGYNAARVQKNTSLANL
jgi:hypothetical protein